MNAIDVAVPKNKKVSSVERPRQGQSPAKFLSVFLVCGGTHEINILESEIFGV